MSWSTSELKKDGQSLWLVKAVNKAMHGLRTHGLPSEATEGFLKVSVPTLAEQARVVRKRPAEPLGVLQPTGVILAE